MTLLNQKQRQKLEVIQDHCLRYARQTVGSIEGLLSRSNIACVD